MLRNFKTQHLIKALAFYKQNNEFFLVFSWAEHGNLRKFWKDKSPQANDASYTKWVFHQLHGLADAIRMLHEDEGNSGGCRHGDIKPENILCFNSKGGRDHLSCVLVISDVGLSRTHDKSTQLRSSVTRLQGGQTLAYAAPETELYPDRATSRRFDIWSLGCLYLEFLIWLLYGFEELDRFEKEVDRKFYRVIANTETLRIKGQRHKAEVNPVVRNWIQRIKEDSQHTGTTSKETAIGRLVAVIETRLLVITASPVPKNQRLPPSQNDRYSPPTSPREKGRASNTPFQVIIRQPTAVDGRMSNVEATGGITPDNSENERAYAPEVCNELESIIRDAETGVIEWNSFGYDRGQQLSRPGSSSTMDPTFLARKDISGRKHEVSAHCCPTASDSDF